MQPGSGGKYKHFYEFPSDVGAALIFAGLAVQIAKPASTSPAKPYWCVREKPVLGDEKWMGDYLLVWTDGHGAVMYFTGSPEAYLKKPPVHQGLEAPRSILEQFARVQGTHATRGLDPDVVRDQLDRQRNDAVARQRHEDSLTAQYNRG